MMIAVLRVPEKEYEIDARYYNEQNNWLFNSVASEEFITNQNNFQDIFIFHLSDFQQKRFCAIVFLQSF